jgi:hypothetical protein
LSIFSHDLRSSLFMLSTSQQYPISTWSSSGAQNLQLADATDYGPRRCGSRMVAPTCETACISSQAEALQSDFEQIHCSNLKESSFLSPDSTLSLGIPSALGYRGSSQVLSLPSSACTLVLDPDLNYQIWEVCMGWG